MWDCFRFTLGFTMHNPLFGLLMARPVITLPICIGPAERRSFVFRRPGCLAYRIPFLNSPPGVRHSQLYPLLDLVPIVRGCRSLVTVIIPPLSPRISCV